MRSRPDAGGNQYVLRIPFSNRPIEESDEEKPGMILGFDKHGNLVGMEILDACKRMENPAQSNMPLSVERIFVLQCRALAAIR